MSFKTISGFSWMMNLPSEQKNVWTIQNAALVKTISFLVDFKKQVFYKSLWWARPEFQ